MRGKSELVQTGDAAKQTSSGLDRDYITQWSYGIGETLTLLVPDFKGGASVPLSESSTAMQKANPQYSSIYGSLTQYFGDQPMTAGPVYVGAFVLFLFILGCFIVKGPMKWALICATIFSIILSWGKNFMPVTDFFIDYMPMYNKFRTVSSILVIAEFTIPLLGIMALKKIIDEPQVLKEQIKAVGAALALTAGVALLIWLAPGMFTEYVPTQEAQMLQNAVNQQMIPADMLSGIVANLGEMREALVTSDALRSFFIIIIGVAFIWLYSAGKLRKEITIGGILLLCLIDMWTVNKRYLYDDQFVSKSVKTDTFVKTKADELILQDHTLDYRVLNLTTNTFNENQTSYWHKSIGGYHAAKLRRYQELIEHHIVPEINALYSEINKMGGDMELVDPSTIPVLNMLNTRYIIFPTSNNDGGTPIGNPNANGNAWFVDEVQYVNNANEEIDALGEVEPLYTAIVDKQFSTTLQEAYALDVDSLATVTLTDYQPNALTYETENSSDGVVVFSEIYYPKGWQVSIDGQPASLARADYVLRALYVPAGHHTIQMNFEPKSIRITDTIAYIGYGLLLLGLIALVWAEKKKLKQS